jgi:spore maturation protein CgeB
MHRLAIYYENRLGRNDGNPLYVWNDLKNRQKDNELEIDHFIPDGDVHVFGNYDFHLYVDWGEDALYGMLPYVPFKTPKPNLCWMSDTHLDGGWRLEKAKEFDIVFFAQQSAVEDAKKAGIEHALWLPHAVCPQAYPNYEIPGKKTDICFVGHINSGNRIDALDTMFKEFPNFFYGQRLFEEAARKYCESKIVFNISIKDDLNMRCFEALATGSFLLTNDIPELHAVFEDGKHLVTYKDMDEAVEKAKYYIEHDEEREKIAREGMRYVLENHTIHHRVNRMLEEINKKLEVKV